MAIVAITNFKGGVGKTTTAIAVAILLSKEGKVLLIDSDQNKSAIQWASYDNLPFDVRLEAEARPLLMSGKYQHVVIDSQAAPDAGEVAALCKGSDLLIVPTSPEPLALKSTGRVAAEATGNGHMMALVTMTPPNPQRDGVDARDALVRAGVPCFERLIRKSKVYVQASESGADMSAGTGRMPTYWRDWVEVGKELGTILQ
ncbi:ATP-binding protein, CobQ/MinD/ParA family [Leptolyngbya sp. PCC 7375]|nr:ATP-binding protein, CobQ/MinD/ParA family [Leptolyngbya sp. PCC 7375]